MFFNQFFYLRKFKIYANKKIKGVIMSSIFFKYFLRKIFKKELGERQRVQF